MRKVALVFPVMVALVCAAAVGGGSAKGGDAPARVLMAGAASVDISPRDLPVIVNGGFMPVVTDTVFDPLHVRCLVLESGGERIAICVMDSCLIPREFAERVRTAAAAATDIAPEKILLSATHTHSAPSLMQALGTGADPFYPGFVLPKVVEAIRTAVARLEPAEAGWTVVEDREHTHNRRWIRRPDKVGMDPFGERTVRANMHPGHENPDAIGPSGPVDPAMTLLAVRATTGRPIAVLANYSMHYFGATAVSADYYGRFCDRLSDRIRGEDGENAIDGKDGKDAADDGASPPFVAIMSQGTSGDLMWMDYGRPRVNPGLDGYADAMARNAFEGYQTIDYRGDIPVVMAARDLSLRMRVPSPERLAWARELTAQMDGRAPRNQAEIYAREQIFLHENPVRDVKVQAIRVGDLGITAMSCEVYALTGLKIKAASPLRPTMNIELANGEDGYIPPPEQHFLGGYTTWACRTAGLEVGAEPKIVEAVLDLLEEVSGEERRAVMPTHGPFAREVLASTPQAYWRFDDMTGWRAENAAGPEYKGWFEPGVAFYLDGPDSPAFSGEAVNRCVHFAGGRMRTDWQPSAREYTIELWFWNGLPDTVREVTGTLFSVGRDRVAIGGNRNGWNGRLVRSRGDDWDTAVVGSSRVPVRRWNHLALTRTGPELAIYLNGTFVPELSGTDAGSVDTVPAFSGGLTVGGDDGIDAGAGSFEGKLDEVAVYSRALSAGEIAGHFAASRMPVPKPEPVSPAFWEKPDAPEDLVRYAPVILESDPAGYWPLVIADSTGPSGSADGMPSLPGTFEEAAGRRVPGRDDANFKGGRFRFALDAVPEVYSVEFWFQNRFPNNSRPVTGYLFSCGPDGVEGAPGDHLGIGGTHTDTATGRLFLFNGNQRNQLLMGATVIQPNAWNHVVLVRNGERARVYLNGDVEPEINGRLDRTIESVPPEGSALPGFFIGGRNDRFANFEGALDHVAFYTRELTAAEARRHFLAARVIATAEKKPEPLPEWESSPLDPADSMDRTHVRAGYRLDLVAAEPLVMDPVAIDWGADGRLWVAEMADYPYGMDGLGHAGGRVRFLEDTDGDGRYDRSVVFADRLTFPTAVMPWGDGVLISAAPEILYARDTDGDGVADEREVLFSGFMTGNQQLRVNGLRYGLDHRVYCANGGHHAGFGSGNTIEIRKTGEAVKLGSRDFRFSPGDHRLEPLSGPSQFGRVRNDWDEWFGVQNSHPLWHYVLEDPWLRRNPHTPSPDPRRQVRVPSNPRVYPSKPPQKRFHSFDQASRFTSACGPAIYRDEWLFARDETTHAFSCEPFHNLVQHSEIVRDGISFTGERAVGDGVHDFFASSDRWSRPVMARTGPDGALWIVDMYRYMIEHPDWLTQEGRDELRPFYRSGDSRGRIYRIVPEGEAARPIPDLSSMNSAGWLEALGNANGPVRDMAQRLLIERNDPDVTARLEALVHSPNSFARLHALHVLNATHRLRPERVAQALDDPDPRVRRHAVRLAVGLVHPGTDAFVSLLDRVEDSSDIVGLELAAALGHWTGDAAGGALGRLALTGGSDPLFRSAVLSSAVPHVGTLCRALARADLDGVYMNYVGDLVNTALGVGNLDGLRALLAAALPERSDALSATQMRALRPILDGLRRRNIASLSVADWTRVTDAADQIASLEPVLGRLEDALKFADTVLLDENAAFERRMAAADLIGADPARHRSGAVRYGRLLHPSIPLELQHAGLELMLDSGDEQALDMILSDWNGLSPALRNRAIGEVMKKESLSATLLREIESGRVSAVSLSPAQRDQMLRHRSDRIRELARVVLGKRTEDRQAVLRAFEPALVLNGDPAAGEIVFRERCAACHRVGEVGVDLGPNLAALSDRSRRGFLAAILDPNLAVEPQYTAWHCVLKSGEELFGLVAGESGGSIRMRLLDGTERNVLRSQIDQMSGTSESLMPVGLEEGLTVESMADLLEFLTR